MKIIDLYGETTTSVLLPAAAVAATANGTGKDLQGYQGVAIVVLNCGAATAGTNPTMDVKIQDSADNSSFADVTGLAFTQVTTVAGVQTMAVDTRTVRRYIRHVVTLGGTSTPSFPMSITLTGQKQTI